MPKNILLRDIPEGLYEWIQEERHHRKMTQQDFLLHVMCDVSAKGIREQPAAYHMSRPPSDPTPQIPFLFVDLFAGIGGFRIALEKVGGHCLFSSEWDVHAQKTYRAWFGEVPEGDITKIAPCDIPDHDILAAGFPCQPFSLAGVSKKKSLGRQHGFADEAQGTLFFYLASIAAIKRPPIMLLENVKNLAGHDGGRTWKVVHDTLEELGYRVFYKVIDARYWVPQHRERIFIVCFDERVFGQDIQFDFPEPPQGEPPQGEPPRLRDVLEENPDPKYTLSDHLWQYLQAYAEKHKRKGNGFGYSIADVDGATRTLSARYHKDGSEILIAQGKAKNPRRLTPRECARLMGFADNLPIVVSDTQAYRQFGNALVPAVAYAVAQQVMLTLRSRMQQSGNCLLKGRSITLATTSEAG